MEQQKDVTKTFNRIGYVLFLLLATYQVLFRKDFIEAASSLGIALVFDPFDQKVTWNDRPLWQRVWMLVHLGIAAAVLGYGISIDL